MLLSSILICFVLGYLCIVLEKNLNVDKAAFSLLTGVGCWVLVILGHQDKPMVLQALSHHLSSISEILFFLLGAMTIVELIDLHGGFDLITNAISTRDKKKLLWVIACSTFLLSAVLDNLTTAIVMCGLCRKLVQEKEERMLYLGLVIIAANAGGAWSPIGDVTTTMLWVAGKISPVSTITHLIIPSLICLIIPTLWVGSKLKGNLPELKQGKEKPGKEAKIIFIAGIVLLLFVPFFKHLTHLPPYMGILLGLGLLWLITEILHKQKSAGEKEKFSVVSAIQKSDVPSILFFLGILAAVGALEFTGLLHEGAAQLSRCIPSEKMVAGGLGLASAIVDNVPLVAAGMGMFEFPANHSFWEILAYTSGTGGSCLIIGSAAGVAVMGIEKISFGWYFKNLSLAALLGYLAGLAYLFWYF